MKTTIAVITLIMLSGCSRLSLQEAEKFCSSRGGLKEFTDMTASQSFTCVDGTHVFQ